LSWLKKALGQPLTNYCDISYDIFCQQNANMLLSEFKNGVIYTFDIVAINQLLSMQTVYYSKKATVLGINMKARGPLYCTGEFYNNIKNTWARPTQYSSWCMFELRRLNRSRKLKAEEQFGQLNYFSRVECANDEYINGLAFANLCIRRHELENKVHSIKATGVYIIPATPVTNLDFATIFVPLRHFVSTKVAFLPLDNSNKPMSPAVKQLSKLTNESLAHCSKDQPEYISKLVMIPLQPYRKGVTITVDTKENLDYKRPL